MNSGQVREQDVEQLRFAHRRDAGEWARLSQADRSGLPAGRRADQWRLPWVRAGRVVERIVVFSTPAPNNEVPWLPAPIASKPFVAIRRLLCTTGCVNSSPRWRPRSDTPSGHWIFWVAWSWTPRPSTRYPVRGSGSRTCWPVRSPRVRLDWLQTSPALSAPVGLRAIGRQREDAPSVRFAGPVRGQPARDLVAEAPAPGPHRDAAGGGRWRSSVRGSVRCRICRRSGEPIQRRSPGGLGSRMRGIIKSVPFATAPALCYTPSTHGRGRFTLGAVFQLSLSSSSSDGSLDGRLAIWQLSRRVMQIYRRRAPCAGFRR
jgi:hypothetical protein